eukprot:TRINITY_DN40273_c0_g1_i1.p1 TRINITY_DN40273_c0_g1~~TRINITY_DN40273_c0_g1_i1.p1  ORF type:complete len:116 (+),score=6.11 TRINITY_DN40273_c0_g1_i1:27-350(+)
MSSGQPLGVQAQRFRGHTSPHRMYPFKDPFNLQYIIIVLNIYNQEGALERSKTFFPKLPIFGIVGGALKQANIVPSQLKYFQYNFCPMQKISYNFLSIIQHFLFIHT